MMTTTIYVEDAIVDLLTKKVEEIYKSTGIKISRSILASCFLKKAISEYNFEIEIRPVARGFQKDVFINTKAKIQAGKEK